MEWVPVYHIKGWGKFNRNYGDFCTGADTPIESAICEQRGEKDFGQPASAGPNWPQITSFRDRRFLAFLDSFRPATIQ